MPLDLHSHQVLQLGDALDGLPGAGVASHGFYDLVYRLRCDLHALRLQAVLVVVAEIHIRPYRHGGFYGQWLVLGYPDPGSSHNVQALLLYGPGRHLGQQGLQGVLHHSVTPQLPLHNRLGGLASAKSGDVYPLHRSTVDSVQVLLQLRGFHLYTQDYLALDLFNLRYFH